MMTAAHLILKHTAVRLLKTLHYIEMPIFKSNNYFLDLIDKSSLVFFLQNMKKI